MDQVGSNWIKLEQIGSDWIRLDQIGLNWINLVQLVTNLIELDQIGINWNQFSVGYYCTVPLLSQIFRLAVYSVSTSISDQTHVSEMIF